MRLLAALLAIVLLPAPLRAQDPPPDKPDDSADDRPTGLPPHVKWIFTFDAGWGTFGFANSLFTDPKEGVKENLSDQWFEGYVKPGLKGSYTFASSSQVYGAISAVGERTYGSVPEVFGQDVSSFQAEDLSIGWKSGHAVALADDAVDVEVGRVRYELGHGMLLYDGAAEGGSRGGYWTNARKAFQFGTIGRLRPHEHHLIEAFYLDRDELPEHDTGSRLWGLNYEFSPDASNTFAFTTMKWAAHEDLSPGRDGLNVYNLRAYTAPVPAVKDLSFEFEYAAERNGVALDSNAWTAQGSYELTAVGWTPKLTYRYAWFQGDDPKTSANEAFDPLLPGFRDWGYWWQGEIAGEYFLANSNLASHMIRAHVTPKDSLDGGLILYKFRLDQPASYGPQVTDRNVALELDAYADWKVNHNFTLTFVGACASPEKAVEQATGRTKNFAYGMVYLAYGY